MKKRNFEWLNQFMHSSEIQNPILHPLIITSPQSTVIEFLFLQRESLIELHIRQEFIKKRNNNSAHIPCNN